MFLKKRMFGILPIVALSLARFMDSSTTITRIFQSRKINIDKMERPVESIREMAILIVVGINNFPTKQLQEICKYVSFERNFPRPSITFVKIKLQFPNEIHNSTHLVQVTSISRKKEGRREKEKKVDAPRMKSGSRKKEAQAIEVRQKTVQ